MKTAVFKRQPRLKALPARGALTINDFIIVPAVCSSSSGTATSKNGVEGRRHFDDGDGAFFLSE